MSLLPRIEIIVLAAGASTRLGTPKQLLCYRGETLLRRTVETALSVQVHAVRVVLGYASEKMKFEISDFPVELIINPQWQQGISTSIRSGIESLDPTVEAAIIVVCDQPNVTSSILIKLIEMYTSSRARIVTCRYSGTVGVPTLYDRQLFPDLIALSGDHGAKPIIERYASERVEIDFPGGEIDIDTVTDQGNLIP
jgi:molybdenum cofactor cytidylyltransferase